MHQPLPDWLALLGDAGCAPCGVTAGQMKMEKEKNRMVKILDLTLEVICLLAGEDCIAVKKASGEPLSPLTLPPPHSQTTERSNGRKILEVIGRITELMTGEIPIRCQDVALYFTMEEWEYLEGHKNLYKEVVMENQPLLASPDVSANITLSKRCTGPLYPQDSALEDRQTQKPFEGENCIPFKAESIDGEGETSVEGNLPSKMEEIAPEILMEQRTSKTLGHLILSLECKTDYSDIIGETSVTSDLHSEFNQEVLLSDAFTSHPILPNVEDFARNIHDLSAPFFCLECGKWFLLKLPLETYTIVTNNLQFSCPTCGRFLTQDRDLPQPRKADVKETLVCLECGKCFAFKSKLVRHRVIHSGVQPYQCSECGKRFKQRAYLNEHQKMHSGEFLFACSECGKRFSRKLFLLNHARHHTDGSANRAPSDRCTGPLYPQDSTLKHRQTQKPFEGENCIQIKAEFIDGEGETSVEGNLPSKMEEITPEFPTVEKRTSKTSKGHLILSLECKTDYSDIIGETSVTSDLHSEFNQEVLLSNAFTSHPILSNVEGSNRDIHDLTAPFFCLGCGKWFLLKLAHEMYKIVTHNLQFSCPTCGRFLIQNRDLPQPRKADVKETLVCLECGKCFAFKSKLVRHRVIHSGVQPYQCSECGKWFKQRAYLNEHQKMHSGEFLFACSECGKRFSRKLFLLNHARRHTGEKPFSCSECGKRFGHMKSLIAHRKVHTGQMSFFCSEEF
ncbi:oocyte zinc finger protein XlCOF7.1-like isoform X3 [Hyperolius riggenbachi]|uniref:oocyte zinc finger protein XlCOF7.1-like isoform X3 n=1 Tax=Hyperolius riggenbachi TaxID=752182 RepID=UPI0035A2FA93